MEKFCIYLLRVRVCVYVRMYVYCQRKWMLLPEDEGEGRISRATLIVALFHFKVIPLLLLLLPTNSTDTQ